jgi:hypothetical protein
VVNVLGTVSIRAVLVDERGIIVGESIEGQLVEKFLIGKSLTGKLLGHGVLAEADSSA